MTTIPDNLDLAVEGTGRAGAGEISVELLHHAALVLTAHAVG